MKFLRKRPMVVANTENPIEAPDLHPAADTINTLRLILESKMAEEFSNCEYLIEILNSYARSNKCHNDPYYFDVDVHASVLDFAECIGDIEVSFDAIELIMAYYGLIMLDELNSEEYWFFTYLNEVLQATASVGL